MRNIQRIVTHNRLLSASICSLLFLAFAFTAARIEKKSGVESLLSAENPLMVTKNKMAKLFGNPNLVFIMSPHTRQDSETIDHLQILSSISDKLETHELVEKIVSPFNVKVAESTSDGFGISKLVSSPPATAAELATLRTRLAASPSFRGQIVALDDASFGLIIQFKKQAADADIKALLLDSLSEFNAQDWSVSGLPVINAWVLEYIDADQAFLVPSFFLFIIAILFLAFGGYTAILITLTNIIVAITFMVAAMVVFGANLNVVTDVLPLLIAALAAAYSVHYLNQYYISQSRLSASASHATILQDTFQKIMPTIAMAALTTILGFLASVTSAIPAVRDFSIFASFGVLGVMLSLLVFSPTLLLLIGKPKTTRRHRQRWITRLLHRCARLSARHPKKIVAVSIITMICSAGACWFVTSKYSALDYFSQRARVVEDARAVSRGFGGFSSFDIVISHDNNPINVRSMKVLDDFTQWVRRQYPEDVKVTFSLAETAKEIRRAYNGSPQYFDLPKSDDEWNQYLEMYEWSSNFRKDFENFISDDGKSIRVTGKFAVIENVDGSFYERPVQYHSSLINQWLDYLRNQLGESYTVEAYGDVPLWSHVVNEVIEGQFRSIVLAVLIIFMVTTVVIRSISIGLICMVPVTIAVLVNFLVMATFGIQLDIATSLISGMALGIGIDDTIHFTLGLRDASREGLDWEPAVEATLLNSGRAIIYTSLALTAGFCTYFISNFQPIVHFGLLNAITLITTTIAAVIVLPSYFIVFKPKFSKEVKS